MCYFLYGAVNRGVNDYDYGKALNSSEYRFAKGNSDDIIKSINIDESFRLTSGHCDCGCALSEKDPEKAEIKAFENLLFRFRDIRGIRYALLLKHWSAVTDIKQETVHIDDISLPRFLADMEENCLYKIELYPRYY